MRLATFCVFVYCWIMPSWQIQSTFAQDRPNVILIIADDLGYGEVECYPNVEEHPLPTPHIDSLASSGVLCTQGYSADPMCWPSRASILTGRYHQRFQRTNPLPDETATTTCPFTKVRNRSRRSAT
jgi:arylsulfatase A-like enzyme